MTEQASYGMEIELPDSPDINESEMSVVLPFANGQRRDGVGDLLEIAGIRLDRHIKNPICLWDHGKEVSIPIGLAEDPKTKLYSVTIDPIGKVAKAKCFMYQGRGLAGVDRSKEYDHALFVSQLFDLIAKRYVRGSSIGYQEIRTYPLQPDYEQGLPQGKHLLITRMLEASAVVLPANSDTVLKALALPRVCGKPLSPWLVKSLQPYAATRKAMLGYERRANICQDNPAIPCRPSPDQSFPSHSNPANPTPTMPSLSLPTPVGQGQFTEAEKTGKEMPVQGKALLQRVKSEDMRPAPSSAPGPFEFPPDVQKGIEDNANNNEQWKKEQEKKNPRPPAPPGAVTKGIRSLASKPSGDDSVRQWLESRDRIDKQRQEETDKENALDPEDTEAMGEWFNNKTLQKIKSIRSIYRKKTAYGEGTTPSELSQREGELHDSADRREQMATNLRRQPGRNIQAMEAERSGIADRARAEALAPQVGQGQRDETIGRNATRRRESGADFAGNYETNSLKSIRDIYRKKSLQEGDEVKVGNDKIYSPEGLDDWKMDPNELRRGTVNRISSSGTANIHIHEGVTGTSAGRGELPSAYFAEEDLRKALEFLKELGELHTKDWTETERFKCFHHAKTLEGLPEEVVGGTSKDELDSSEKAGLATYEHLDKTEAVRHNHRRGIQGTTPVVMRVYEDEHTGQGRNPNKPYDMQVQPTDTGPFHAEYPTHTGNNEPMYARDLRPDALRASGMIDANAHDELYQEGQGTKAWQPGDRVGVAPDDPDIQFGDNPNQLQPGTYQGTDDWSGSGEPYPRHYVRQDRYPAPDDPDSLDLNPAVATTHIKPLKSLVKFLLDLSTEKAFGEPHRQKAMEMAKALGEVRPGAQFHNVGPSRMNKESRERHDVSTPAIIHEDQTGVPSDQFRYRHGPNEGSVLPSLSNPHFDYAERQQSEDEAYGVDPEEKSLKSLQENNESGIKELLAKLQSLQTGAKFASQEN